MKTPFEIKNGLEICPKGLCVACPYPYSRNCQDALVIDALAYIQQLEAELEAVKRERDAAIADMKKFTNCHACKRWDEDGKEGCQVKDDCLYGTIGKFEWRGVCPENTEV